MPRLTSFEAPPANTGEPQSVRDAYDRTLERLRQANAVIEEATAEIEIS